MIDLLANVADSADPWWLRAVLGSLGALVLAVLANVVQWRRADEREKAFEKKESAWDGERERLNDAIKAESDRATEYGERVLTLMTKAEIHLEASPRALEKIGDTVSNEHITTRDKIDSGFRELERKKTYVPQ